MAKATSTPKLKPTAGLLPDIAKQCLDDPRWTRIFLPTLTHVFYLSDHPFHDWKTTSSTFIRNLQMVFDLTFTNISGSLGPDDDIVKAVRPTRLLLSLLMFLDRLIPGSKHEGRRSQATSSSWCRTFLGAQISRTNQPRSRTTCTGLCGVGGQHTTKLLFRCCLYLRRVTQITQ